MAPAVEVRGVAMGLQLSEQSISLKREWEQGWSGWHRTWILTFCNVEQDPGFGDKPVENLRAGIQLTWGFDVSQT